MSMSPQQLQQLLRAGQAGSQLAGQNGYSNLGAMSPYLGNAASGLGVLNGIQQGGVSGYGGAALGAANLAGKAGAYGSAGKAVGNGLGGASNALGIYNGIKQGGVGGYGGAAVNAAQLGSRLGSFGGYSGAVGSAAGYAAAPLALYNEINNWESGNTGADAMGGAATGAAIGSIVPGIGTAIGALVGGAAGALSSAFGPGRVDPENANFNAYTDAYNKASKQNPALGNQVAASSQNPYLALAGMFDLRKPQIKGNIPIYNTYGRKGEKKFSDDLVSHVQQAQASGALKPGASANDIYNTAISPWISTLGNWQDSNKDSMTALLKQMGSQAASGAYKNDWKAIGGDSPWGTPAPPMHNARRGQTYRMARGGTVNDYERAARLHAIYTGGLHKPGYDDGGSVDYFTPTAGGYEFNPPPLQDFGSAGTGWSDTTDPFSSISQSMGDYGSIVNSQNDPYAYADPSGGSQAQTGASGLASLLKGLGISGNTAQSMAPYAALAPILGSLMGVGNNSKAPALPPGYGQAMNIPTPTNTRQQNNLSGMSMNDWLHAGEGPELQFYQNNALPATQMSSPGQQVAQAVSAANGQPFAGGSQYAPIPGGHPPAGGQSGGPPGMMHPMPELRGQPLQNLPVMAHGGPYDSPEAAYGSAHGHVKGPGDGTSDSIQLRNAYLSNGEFVMDAPTVSMLGNGSNDAGANWLEGLRTHVRKHSGKSMVRGKQPMDSASAASAYAYGAAS